MTDLRQVIAELEIADLCDFSLSQQCPSRINRDKYKYHICIASFLLLYAVQSNVECYRCNLCQIILLLGLTFARSRPAGFCAPSIFCSAKHRTMPSPAALSGAAAISSRLASATASSVSASGTVAASSIASFSSDSSQSIPPPNRMTKAFHEMKQTCPQEMQAYADCVVRGHREGNLDRGACQAEFDLVKACFRSARRSGRS